VPVDGGALLRAGDVVVNSHGDGVTPVGLDSGAGEGAVDQEGRDLISIGGDDAAGDGEVVAPYYTGGGALMVRVGPADGLVAPGLAMGEGVVGKEDREQGSEEGTKTGFSVWLLRVSRM
jgi:hypothetical protein